MRGGWPRKRRKSLDPGCFAQYTEKKQKEETAMKLGVETIWQDRKRVLGMPLTFTNISFQRIGCSYRPGC